MDYYGRGLIRISPDPYRDAYVHLSEGNEELARHFNSKGVFGDLIHDPETGHYLLIERSTNPVRHVEDYRVEGEFSNDDCESNFSSSGRV